MIATGLRLGNLTVEPIMPISGLGGLGAALLLILPVVTAAHVSRRGREATVVQRERATAIEDMPRPRATPETPRDGGGRVGVC